MFFGPHTDEAKRKISIGNKGRITTQYQKEKISKALIDHWSKIPLEKRTQDPEVVEARRQKILGTKQSDETKRRNSESRKAAWIIQKANGYKQKKRA